jgi:hypothetical protein
MTAACTIYSILSYCKWEISRPDLKKKKVKGASFRFSLRRSRCPRIEAASEQLLHIHLLHPVPTFFRRELLEDAVSS